MANVIAVTKSERVFTMELTESELGTIVAAYGGANFSDIEDRAERNGFPYVDNVKSQALFDLLYGTLRSESEAV